jgi:hypothetical protein
MTSMNNNAEGIDARILADLRPVRPLAAPWKRGLTACGAAALAGVLVTARYGVRADAAALGPAVLWGLSLLQAVYGVLLVGAALREAVPGRGLARGSAPLLLLAGVGLVLAVTALTWSVHASHVPAGKVFGYWRLCFEMPTLAGLPALAITLLLAFRAYPTRPVLTGALAGLGAGLLADGSWRTFCEVTDPSHVLSAHFASVLLLTLVGVVVAAGTDRLRR